MKMGHPTLLDIDAWKYINAYRNLIWAGKVKDFTCHRCNSKANVMLGDDGFPIVNCFTCGTVIQPNARWYDQIKAVVKEHNE